MADPRTHAYIVDHLAPGKTISRRMAVTNGNGQASNVVLYPVAASIHNGEFLAADGRGANELTTWMTMSPTDATIRPGETLAVTLTIAVPATAGAGERYAAALAEVPAVPGTTGVNLVSRVGIRVYLSVGSGGPPPSSFSIDTLTAGRDPEGSPRVSVQVHNTGGRALDLSGDLRLDHGPAGLSAGPFPAKLGTTLAVGDRESVIVVLDRQLPAGPWDAEVRLVSGLLTERATGSLTFPTTGTAAAGPAAAVAPRGGSAPWAIPLGGSAFLAAGAAGMLILSRRRALAGQCRELSGTSGSKSVGRRNA